MPPIGLGYIAASLQKKGHDVSIIDCALKNLDTASFAKELDRWSPEIVGFQSYSYEIPAVNRYIDAIKNTRPDCIAAVGGPHPSAAPNDFFKHYPRADYGFAGEAEESLPMLLEHIEKGIPVPAVIPGLIRKDGDKTIANPPKWIEDLSSLGIPAWELLDPLSYPGSPQGVFFKRFPVASIFTTRGCPYPCTFCGGKLVMGGKIRRRPMDDVLNEIEFLIGRYGIREFHILDDNFSSKRDQVVLFCDGLKKRKIDISWCCPNGLRLDTLDTDLLRRMKDAGCYSISVGVESGSAEILKKMKKGFSPEIIERQIRTIRQARMAAIGFFIIGFPGETAETIEETIRFACRLPLNRASFFNYIPLPGTETADRLLEENRLKDIPFEELHCALTPYSDEKLSAAEIKSLQRKAFLKFYLRPRVLLEMLASIRSFRQFKYILNRARLYL